MATKWLLVTIGIAAVAAIVIPAVLWWAGKIRYWGWQSLSAMRSPRWLRLAILILAIVFATSTMWELNFADRGLGIRRSPIEIEAALERGVKLDSSLVQRLRIEAYTTYDSALIDIGLNDLKEAIEHLDRVINDSTVNSRTRVKAEEMKGLIALESGEESTALQAFENVLQDDSMSTLALVGKTLALVEQGEDSSVWEPALQQLIERQGEVGVYYYRAKIFYQVGRLEDAKSNINLALSMEPDHRQARILKDRIVLAQQSPEVPYRVVTDSGSGSPRQE